MSNHTLSFTLQELKEMMASSNGSLDLEGCTSITSLPEGLTVSGYLDLSGTSITSLPEGLTVGGYLDLSGTSITDAERNKVKKLRNGDYVPGRYLYADDMLYHIKRRRKIGNYTFYCGKIPGKNVVSDGINYAHCTSFKMGVEDLAFKRAKDRGADQYKSLTLDSIVSFDDAKTMYRVITGACRQGTDNFIATVGAIKDTYTVCELIDITRGQYGSSIFSDFFKQCQISLRSNKRG